MKQHKNSIFITQDNELILGDENYIDKKELCKRLKVSRQSVQRWMRQGCPYTEFKNKIAFDLQEVKNWRKIKESR